LRQRPPRATPAPAEDLHGVATNYIVRGASAKVRPSLCIAQN